jgi:FkbH-like protein
MSEPVRLVIWDLDDTFWKGTLSEGGIEEYLDDAHGAIIALAKRGIMSSICSKNDFALAEKVLREKGIWDYFVFPSIDWSPKGERVAAIVDAMQLRPASVMFIDDNHLNRAEVAQRAPEIQISDETLIAKILEHPLFQGKDDSTLTRLQQYKLLESRHAEKLQSGGDNKAFLRSSNIRVIIETDIESNIDRAIELINRTNQLNFTKRRLSENIDVARADLRRDLSPTWARAGLVRVIDRYGDYGYCGFYLIAGQRLTHFCFSCRTLGMAVEAWLYQRLDRPEIAIEGKVLTDIVNHEPVDWIRIVDSDRTDDETPISARIPAIRLRGGCDVSAMAHYFKVAGGKCSVEGGFSRTPNIIRHDTAITLQPAINSWDDEFLKIAGKVGYLETDFVTDFLAPSEPGTLLVYRAFADVWRNCYVHKQSGHCFKLDLEGVPAGILSWTPLEVEAWKKTTELDAATCARVEAIIEACRDEFTPHWLSDGEFAELYRRVCLAVPIGAHLAILLSPESQAVDGEMIPWEDGQKYNDFLRKVTREFSWVSLISIDDCVKNVSERLDRLNHFDRQVYVRLYESVLAAYDRASFRELDHVGDATRQHRGADEALESTGAL